MILEVISEESYQKQLDAYDRVDFLQSVQQAEKMKDNGWNVEFVQGVEDGEVKACAMLCMIPLMKIFHYCYIPRGFIADYTDEKTVHDFTRLLKHHLQKKNVVYMEMEPPIILHERDQNGDIVEGGTDHTDVVEILKKCGYEHLPLKKGYDLSKECRYVSVLDLSGKTEDQVFQSFIPMTRHNIKNTIKNNVRIRELKRDELHILKDLVNMSGEKQHYETFSLEFFEKEFDFFKENVKAYEAYLDVPEYVRGIEENIRKEEETVAKADAVLAENPYSKNSQNRKKVALSNLEALHKRQKDAKQLLEEYPDELPLAAAMFIFYKGQVYYLSSGSDDSHKNFKGPYALQWYMIRKAIAEGYDRYNFYGISGYFQPGEEGYGVFDFKRGFNAVVEEYIGNFILPIKPVTYQLYRKMKTV